ncbi:hypothetical protein KBTX_04428 [wastewater metagenome]|uniref:Uncharacterized protein n=2 Tax=unclassified sequences TaxID=12908 RepID=A0A5B8RGQ5_9ZZZZ|nr:hypothetical protein KBTEX_04428 [uncultured organism]
MFFSFNHFRRLFIVFDSSYRGDMIFITHFDELNTDSIPTHSRNSRHSRTNNNTAGRNNHEVVILTDCF